MSLVTAEGVARRYGDLMAVDGVDLTLAGGEVVGLLGANGAGKTTLIRLVLGLEHPTAGRVELFGEPPSRATRRRLGYVPQRLGLYDDLTPAENLAFAASVFGGGDGVGGLPDDLRELADVPVGQLPLGVQRRMAFVQALAHDPELLVLDEPTSGVDPLARARLWETIRDTADHGAGVLVTTHYMEEAEECDRLVVMAAGRVVDQGTVAEIVGDARVVAVEADDWAAALAALDEAGISAALVGTRLRVPDAPPDQVRAALGDLRADVHAVPATLDERFFQLVAVTATTVAR